jgi:hypothetical protein
VPRKTRKQEHAAALYQGRKQYAELLEQQGGLCAICKTSEEAYRARNSGRRFHVDHDHKTMELRGLLCFRCNRALPNYVTATWLEAAAAYLRSHG